MSAIPTVPPNATPSPAPVATGPTPPVTVPVDPNVKAEEAPEVYETGLNLSRAIVKLLSKEPLYGYMLLDVSYRSAQKDDKIETACMTAKGDMIFNEKFFSEITMEHRIGVIKHELFHLLFRHCAESEFYPDGPRYNVAADLAINQMLPEIPTSGKFAGLHPSTFKLKNGQTLPLDKSADDYYDLLPKDHQELADLVSKNLGAAGNSNGGLPDHRWGEMDQDTKDKLEEQAKKIIESIDPESSKTRGTIPAGLKDMINSIKKVRRLNWKQILRNYVKRYLSCNYRIGWKKPDRRLGQIPSRIRDKMPVLGVAVDTSGSTMAFRSAFSGELDSIRRESGCRMVIVECDAYVGAAYVVQPKDKWTPPTKYTGGGGTAFQPAIDWFIQNYHKHKVGCVIYLTDGYGEHPQKAPLEFPVIWAVCGHESIKAAAFGKHIYIDYSNLNER